uniref:Uncharacterized protein n=1 Tax=Romanomermis culicivorax TaxID=13658 RepID=A0A915HNH0_ROMCU
MKLEMQGNRKCKYRLLDKKRTKSLELFTEESLHNPCAIRQPAMHLVIVVQLSLQVFLARIKLLDVLVNFSTRELTIAANAAKPLQMTEGLYQWDDFQIIFRRPGQNLAHVSIRICVAGPKRRQNASIGEHVFVFNQYTSSAQISDQVEKFFEIIDFWRGAFQIQMYNAARRDEFIIRRQNRVFRRGGRVVSRIRTSSLPDATLRICSFSLLLFLLLLLLLSLSIKKFDVLISNTKQTALTAAAAKSVRARKRTIFIICDVVERKKFGFFPIF